MNPSANDYLLRLYSWASLALFLQGAALVLSWIVHERALSNARPRLRYRLLCLHLACFLMVPFITVGAVHWLTSATLIGAEIPGRGAGIAHPEHSQPIILLAHLLFTHAPIILGVWAGGALVSGIGFACAWRRASSHDYEPASPQLIRLVGTLSTELGLKHPPTSLQADVDIPYVVGVRRPAIILPRTLDQFLSPEELRAVLLHELAHIQRRDFFWNLVQRSIAGLVWFHPGIWYLYTRVKRERERCCDAMAVQYCHQLDLAHGLFKLLERMTSVPPALTSASVAGSLEVRFRSLLSTVESPRPRLVSLLPSTSLLLISAAAIWIGTLASRDSALRSSFVASSLGPIVSVTAHDDAGSFELKMQHGKVLAFAFEDRPVERSRILQTGNSVLVVSASGKPMVALQVDPGGGIRWEPRPQTHHPD
jgi:beta-lactamase regulating signal transducer with metallopeptidase domain